MLRPKKMEVLYQIGHSVCPIVCIVKRYRVFCICNDAFRYEDSSREKI